MTTAMAAILGQSHRLVEAAGAGADAGGLGDSEEIHSSACFTSRADCQRLSGSFSRHVATTRSSAGGDSGCSSLNGLGWSFRIDATRLVLVLPSKARLPVISS